MTLSQQTFTSNCGCVIEQIHDPDEGIDPIPIVLNHCCEKHESVVKNKHRLSLEDFNKKREEILIRYQGMLDNNRKRHLKQFDNSKNRKDRMEAVKEGKQSLITAKFALMEEAKLESERQQTIQFLDNHEQENMIRLMTGLNSQYSMFAKEVHDTILLEQNDGR